MPSQPCPNTVPCFPCPDDTPVLNLSAEAPDAPTYVSNIVIEDPPPIGTTWSATGCLGTCISTVSLADAEECARLQADLCELDSGNGPEIPGDPQKTLFYSPPIICNVLCPDGTVFQNTVPGGIVRSIYSQNDATFRARQICLALAAAKRICFVTQDQKLCSQGAVHLQIQTAGGINPKTFSIVAGALPTGLVMSASGLVTGVPTVGGSFTFTLLVHDAQAVPATAVKTYTWVVIEILPATLPNGTIGVAYAQALTENGGVAPETWAVTSGSLPPGITLHPATGVLSGVPTSVGLFVFEVAMTDSSP